MDVQDYLKFANKIKNSKIYKSIEKEKLRLEKEGFNDNGESERMAWKNKKYLILKKVIEPFIGKYNIANSS